MRCIVGPGQEGGGRPTRPAPVASPAVRRSPSPSRRSLLLAVALGAAAVAGACTSDAPATPDDPQLQLGAEVYGTRCAGCHGQSGGGGAGVRLAGRMKEAYPDIADQIAVITNGRRAMPAFGDSLTPEQIEAVAMYEREVL